MSNFEYKKVLGLMIDKDRKNDHLKREADALSRLKSFKYIWWTAWNGFAKEAEIKF
jgi:hypothetical protein